LEKELVNSRIITLDGIGEVTMTRKQRIKRLAISVRPFSGVRVNVPVNVSFRSAEKFVFEKKLWIKKSLNKFQGIENQYPVFDGRAEYTTKDHRLKIIPHGRSTIKLIIKGSFIYVFYPSFADVKDERIQKAIRKAIIEAWRIEAKKYLPDRVRRLALEHGFKFGKISLRNAKTRWGSCSYTNNINLNIQLMRLPDHLIDYIILHELTHTVHRNHGRSFWSLLDNISGNAKKLNREIKKYNLYYW
jgi:predicted metal-dependent hydrolase